MTRRRVSVALFTFISIFLAVSAYAADWNETHIYNPRWPPHAKFHNARTMLLGTLLAGMTLFFTWLGFTHRAPRRMAQVSGLGLRED